MKKLKYLLLLFPFLFIDNVHAIPLGYPVVWYHENGVAYQLSNVTLDTWGGTEVYVGSNIGRISSSVDITRVDYNWYNANLCSGKTINIKGRLFGLGGLFNYNASLAVYSNGNQMVCSTTVIDQNQMDFNCYSDTGGGDISVYMSTVVNYNDNFRTGISRNIDVTCDVTNEAIVSQSIQNTQDIINNQNQNTNTITQNQDSNTQDIINNQNQNTEQQIESQQVCKNIDKINILQDNKYLNENGNINDNRNNGITDYINIYQAKIKVLDKASSTVTGYTCFYNINKVLISCINGADIGEIGSYIIIPNNSYYMRLTINKNTNRPSVEICQNGNQALNDTINSLNDSITSTDSPTSIETNDTLNDFSENVASDAPITDLLTMPLTLINAYITGMNSSCTPYNFGTLLGTNLTMPCINLEQRLGSNIWNIIDVLFSIFMIFNISKLFIGAFNKLTTLKDDFSTMYTNDYQPRHGGDE